MQQLQFALLAAVVAFVSAGHGHGGPLGNIYSQLTEEQRQQLTQIFTNNQNATKAVFKQALNSFIATLPSNLQTEVSQANATFHQKIQENSQKVQSLSSDAQSLYNQITTIVENDSLTKQQTKDQIRQLFQSANQTTVQELKSAGVFIPGGHGHHGGHGSTGNPLSSESNENQFGSNN